MPTTETGSAPPPATANRVQHGDSDDDEYIFDLFINSNEQPYVNVSINGSSMCMMTVLVNCKFN
jgi:hypothetical protein